MIVPNRMVKGGIASVVNGYRGSKLEKDYDITYVESYTDGSKLTKLFKGISGYIQFIKVLLTNKPDIVHIHSSFGPSFYRKMPFIYMASWAKIPIVNHIHGADFDEFYVNACNSVCPILNKRKIGEENTSGYIVQNKNDSIRLKSTSGAAVNISVMPTNLYGPNDNYHPTHSHVLPALIRRFHEAKVNGLKEVTCWGDFPVFYS